MEQPVQPMPLFPNVGFPIANNALRGTGQISWLSSKAGLITCHKPIQATISFQLKDFWDTQVSDLTAVLRPGFLLAFHAVSSDTNDWIATSVAPIDPTDPSVEEKEVNLEVFEQSFSSNSRQSSKDPYSLRSEMDSLIFLLQIFQQNRSAHIPLSTLHSKISNSGNDELYRYVGSSSLKRRQFVERRSYIFHITDNDIVFLQQPEVYTTVCLLANFLMHHGGVTASSTLFAFFNSSTAMPAVIRDPINSGTETERRRKFMEFLNRHPFVFSPFPSQYTVSVRRALPYFDYNSFMKKNFPVNNTASLMRSHSVSGSFTNAPTPLNAFNSFEREPISNFGYGSTAPSYPPVFDDVPVTPNPARIPPSSPWSSDLGSVFQEPPYSKVLPTQNAQPIMGGNGNMMSGRLDSMLNGAGFEPMRRMGYASISPPLTAMRRTAEMATQTSESNDMARGFDKVERAVGPEVHCTCRCQCSARFANENPANPWNGIPPQQTAIGSEQKARRESPPHNPFFTGFPPLLPQISSSSSPDGSANGTPESDHAQQSIQQPQLANGQAERAFDPFGQVYPFELKLTSLRL